MMEYNIKKILVPIDFSPASINALDTAMAMAKENNAAIVLMNVVETITQPGLQSGETVTGETLNERVRQSEKELKVLQNSMSDSFPVPSEIICCTGLVSSSIINTSTNCGADMIVMGTHGVSGFKDLFIGSNAYNVVKNSACPVLTIPSQKKWLSFQKILFPLRAIPAALEKYDFVRKIIRKNETVVKILGLATDYDTDVDLLKSLASRLNEKLKDDKVEAATYFKVGRNMAEEVLKMATLMETQLIVITATIDTTVKEFFAGNYTRHIINHARFPVLSIRP